jgi:hypothetical protein
MLLAAMVEDLAEQVAAFLAATNPSGRKKQRGAST